MKVLTKIDQLAAQLDRLEAEETELTSRLADLQSEVKGVRNNLRTLVRTARLMGVQVCDLPPSVLQDEAETIVTTEERNRRKAS